MTTSHLRLGMIGCGKIAQTHAEAIAGLHHAKLTACCDLIPERAHAMATSYDVAHVFDEAGQLLESGLVDAVTICTPHPSHAPLAIRAAAAGVHAIVEKPMTTDPDEADLMIQAAERARTKLAVIFQRRFWPAAQRMRRAIDNGQIGAPILGECFAYLWRGPEYYGRDPWRGRWDTEGGGVLMNQAVHVLDLLQWYMGPVVEVHGRWANLAHQGIIDVEDVSVSTLLFESGALGTITTTTALNPPIGFRVAVLGDTGHAISVLETPESSQGVNDLWKVPGEEQQQEVWEGQDRDRPGFPLFHRLQLQDFVDAILDDRDPAVTGIEGRKAIALINAIYRSQATGLPVRFDATGQPASDGRATSALGARA
jgi:UDP-N-acetyl-2-amino-2-deoxyglucuronate dehydrogenase